MFGLTPEQILEILKSAAPAALSVIGTVVAALLAVIGWAMRSAWGHYKKQNALQAAEYRLQMGKMAKALHELAAAVAADRKTHGAEDARLRESIVGLRAELAIATNAMRNEVAGVGMRVDNAIKGLAGVEAICRLQQDKLEKVSEGLSLANGKLVAVFRFIDARKRATDDADGTNG